MIYCVICQKQMVTNMDDKKLHNIMRTLIVAAVTASGAAMVGCGASHTNLISGTPNAHTALSGLGLATLVILAAYLVATSARHKNIFNNRNQKHR